jgi:hypothetical protein
MKKTILFCVGIYLLFSCSSTKQEFDYLNQAPPVNKSEVFAPNIISNNLPNRDISISADGNEIYFTVQDMRQHYSSIGIIRRQKEKWGEPKLLSFCKNLKYKFLEASLSYDDQILYFASNMPNDQKGEPIDMNIWKANRVNGEFTQIEMLDSNINTDGDEYFPSPIKDGSLYITRNNKGERKSFIYKSKFENGNFTKIQLLPNEINCGEDRFNAFVNPDEKYVIVSTYGIEGQISNCDYYIIFRNFENNKWKQPVNMGKCINLPKLGGWSAYVTKDEKYMFFMDQPREQTGVKPNFNYSDFLKLSGDYNSSKSNVYWIQADFIEKLRK